METIRKKKKNSNHASSEQVSLELLAKFAAEKERQENILVEERRRMGELDDNSNISSNKQTNNQSSVGRKKRIKRNGLIKQQNGSNFDPPIPSNLTYSHASSGQAILLPSLDFRSSLSRSKSADIVNSLIEQKSEYASDPIQSVTNSMSISNRIESSKSAGKLQPLPISGTEAQFMIRQINSSDFPSSSLVSQMDSFSPMNLSNQTKPNDFINDAMKDRLLRLENQIVLLNQSLQKKEQELVVKDHKIKWLTQDIETQKMEFNNQNQRLNSQHEMDILRLKEEHAREQANLANVVQKDIQTVKKSPTKSKRNYINNPPDDDENQPSPTSYNARSPSKAEQYHNEQSGYEANSKLMKQLDNLREEHKKLQDQYAEERRLTQNEFNNKLFSQEKKLKSEIMELKSQFASLEDQLVLSQDECNSLHATIDGLNRLNAQLEAGKQSAIEGQNKLRNEMKTIQQSNLAKSRLDVSHGAGVSSVLATNGANDPQMVQKLIEAKNEAKVRQLMNKVEFLKSQVDAERKACEEAKIGMESTNLKLDEIRNEFKLRMLEAEKSRRNAVEETEQRLESYYEGRMKELTSLQSKVMIIQGQLQTSFEENLLIQQREEAAKAASNKALAHQAAMKTEVEQLREQIQELRNEKDKDLAKETQRQTTDATIRRLDNERQYLKSQLASEMTHKNELQMALTKSQQQLVEAHEQWSRDVNSLKESLSIEQHRFQLEMDSIKQSELKLQNDVSRLSNQNKDLKEAFTKARDQVRMEQLGIENVQTNNRRLQDALDATKSDIHRLKETAAKDAVMHQEQIEAIHDTIQKQNELREVEMNRLKDALSKQYTMNSQSQMASLNLREQFEVDKIGFTRRVNATKLFLKIDKWRNNRLQMSFRLWSTNSTLMGVAQQFRKNLEKILDENSNEFQKEKSEALDRLKQHLKKEHETAMELFQREQNEIKQEALRQARMEQDEMITALESRHEEQLLQIETDHAFDLDQAKKEAAKLIENTIDMKNKQFNDQLERHNRDMKVFEMRANVEKLEAIQQKEEEMNQVCINKLTDQSNELMKLQEKRLLEAAVEADFKCYNLETKYKEDLLQMVKRHEAEVLLLQDRHEESIRRLNEEWNEAKLKEMDDLKLQLNAVHEKGLSDLRLMMHEQSEQRVRELRTVWEKELQSTLDENQKLFEEKLSIEMEKYGKSLDGERLKALKLEASKWRQALRDAEEIAELEANRLKATIIAEKDVEMKNELEKATNRFEQQKQREADKHRERIEEMERDFKWERDRDLARYEVNLQTEREAVEKRVKQSCDERWEAKRQEEKTEWEAVWNAKLTKEKERLEQFKQDSAIQSKQLANERSMLLSRIAKNEELIRSIEDMSQTEATRMRSDFEAEKRLLELKWDEKLDLEQRRMNEEKERLMEQLANEAEENLADQLRLEKNRMGQELSRQMNALQQESERLMGNLESAVTDLKEEKSTLAIQLEAMASKLEDTEDALFDQQQLLKSQSKQQSLWMWKSAAHVMKLKERYQKGIEDFDVEASKRLDSLRSDMQLQVNDQMLVVLKLAALLMETEQFRKKQKNLLVSYKTDELTLKRNRIKLIEKELERLNVEKDTMEEQKDATQVEIDHLEQEVRVLEDQIREHNRNSSMTNGRINVAHARKKRRLDAELERVLDLIEQKRGNMLHIDERIAEKGRQRDEKESDMIDQEKDLVQILLEQQRNLLAKIEEGKDVEDKHKLILTLSQYPWPPPNNPTINDVMTMLKIREKEVEEGIINR